VRLSEAGLATEANGNCGSATDRGVYSRGRWAGAGWLTVATLGAPVLALCPAAQLPALAASPAAESAYVGNEACAACHGDIYERYSRTAMARTSGPASRNLIEGSVRHVSSGVVYRISVEGTKAYLNYERPGDPGLRGRHELQYYVGSSTRGSTFLFEIDGFLYKSPINYFVQKKGWDMSPEYHSPREMELKPAPPACLFCHASRIQPPAPGASNRYGSAPFLQDGVGCERCHGPGGEHVRGMGVLVNPARLTGERRDSVCIQCHLPGEASVARPGKTLEMYRPGDLLSDYSLTFVYDDAGRGALGAISHVEALALSHCARRSAGRMACITCHDPHTAVPGPERVAYYRDKCLSCHARSFADRHQQGSPDCIGCHMPRRESVDGGHVQVTDHRIPRRAWQARAGLPTSPPPSLVPFGRAQAEPRDLGLAYAQVALRGDGRASQEALRLLAEALPRYPRDAEVLIRLGYLYQQLERNGPAAELYERALQAGSEAPEGATNLGVIYASKGDLKRALALWQGVFGKNPGLSEAGVNLAAGLCQAGETAKARQTLVEVLKHQTDFSRARAMLRELESRPERCPAPTQARDR
jgi:Tfp pilus assembly protein PilF